MTVINGMRIVRIHEDARIVIGPATYSVEHRSVDATGNDAWTNFGDDEGVESVLVEVIRRHDRAEMIDDGLCDLRVDVKPAPPAPVKDAFVAPTTPRFKLVRADEVPAGVAAEYYGPDVRRPQDYVDADNMDHGDFNPELWPREENSVWACVDTWGIQHPSNRPAPVEAKSAECLVWEASSEDYTPNCTKCGHTFGEHPVRTFDDDDF